MIIRADLGSRSDDLKPLELRGVTLHCCILGQGSYGTVYKAEHNGIACAAKRVDLSSSIKLRLAEQMRQNFLLECLQHSKLNHPNIVKMLGVFYPKKIPSATPILVMELMECNLSQLLEKSYNIPMYVKLSILQDVSRGICYLHTQNPPIVHQALYSDNILITKGLTAKIGDFKTGAETLSDQVVLSIRRNRASDGFLPDSRDILKYDGPLNVFSFGCIICHVITQKLPSMQQHESLRLQEPSGYIYKRKRGYLSITPQKMVKRKLEYFNTDSTTSYTTDDWSVRNYQDYIDLISDHSLKQLVEACLQYNCEDRPHMLQVYERVTDIMAGEFIHSYV